MLLCPLSVLEMPIEYHPARADVIAPEVINDLATWIAGL